MAHANDAKLPENFHRIRLELAREPGHPEGDAHTGYVIVAPLDGDGRIDIDTARDFRDSCTVVRMRPGAEPERGILRRRPGGSWALHYDLEAGEDDDPGYRLGEHRFVPGEYVTIIEDAGEHTYRIITVQRL
ncbi:hypothetical protein [Terricaulis sp.]|uniref:hypothetical protein n=1 Tax=Terricaulis sp. TaxID=2768686 RepID=UPI003782FBBE